MHNFIVIIVWKAYGPNMDLFELQNMSKEN